MAIIKCHECGKQVSTEAKACPSCGAKVRKPVGWVGLFIAVVVVLLMFKCGTDSADKAAAVPKKASLSPAEVKDKEEKERKFQADVLRVKLLKASLKNPDSFQLVQAVRMNNEVLCVQYRGTNSFNAVITEQKAISDQLKFVDWNKNCGGKTGIDMSHVRHAL